MDPVVLLGRHGDPLERAIVVKPMDLDNLLQPYATVWAEQIVPRRLRDNPSRVILEWMNFAGSHYTTLIQTHHAAKALAELVELCSRDADPHDGEFLLEVHRRCGTFWQHMGSAVDNLGATFMEAPTVREKKGKDYVTEKSEYLGGYIYNRRTQFIHSRLVPVTVTGGGVAFYFEHLGSATGKLQEVPEKTDWRRQYTLQELLDDFCNNAWRRFREEMSRMWWILYTRLREGGPLPDAPKAPDGACMPITLDGESPISNIRLSDQVSRSGPGGPHQTPVWPSGSQPPGTGPSGGW